MAELTKEELKELYLPGTEDFVIVDVPDLQFAMIDGASSRLGEIPATPRLGRPHEGTSVQIMYVGDYSQAARAIAERLHHNFLPEHDLVPNGHHHEIYLTDPNRMALERMRTVVRQPVRPRTG